MAFKILNQNELWKMINLIRRDSMMPFVEPKVDLLIHFLSFSFTVHLKLLFIMNVESGFKRSEN